MSSAAHRLGLVPCPLCKNTLGRVTCKACKGAGMMPVDEAIKTGLAISDTERELQAVHLEDENKGERGP